MEISVENLETPAEAPQEQPEIPEEKVEIQEEIQENEEIQEEIPEPPPLVRQPEPKKEDAPKQHRSRNLSRKNAEDLES